MGTNTVVSNDPRRPKSPSSYELRTRSEVGTSSTTRNDRITSAVHATLMQRVRTPGNSPTLTSTTRSTSSSRRRHSHDYEDELPPTNSNDSSIDSSGGLEPPWLRDKRRHRLDQLKERRRQSNSRSNSTNPFDSPQPPKQQRQQQRRSKRFNPFDSSDSSSALHHFDSASSSSMSSMSYSRQSRQRTTPNPSNGRNSNNPFESPVVKPRPTVSTGKNPFDSPVVVKPRPTISTGINPFSGSSSSSSKHRATPVSSSPSSAKYYNRSRYAHAPPPSSKDSVALDSLDQILDTTDETTQDDSSHDDNNGIRGPSVAESSLTESSAPSETARQAAETLRQSFARPRSPVKKQSTRDDPRPPSGPVAAVAAAAAESTMSSIPIDLDDTVDDSTTTTFNIIKDDNNVVVSRRSSPDPSGHRQPQPQPQQTDEEEEEEEEEVDPASLTLHYLMDEAPTTDDLAWRNALSLLSVQPKLVTICEPEQQMTPLHHACLTTVTQPAPIWMIRALLYSRPEQTLQPDGGGRLPLHLLCATSANVDSLRLLVEEAPSSVAHVDDRGFTPLQLLLKNDQISLTLEHLRLALGQVLAYGDAKNNEEQETIKRPVYRKGEHLEQSYQDLLVQAQHCKQQAKHEGNFPGYPDDVQSSLNKIVQWKRRQQSKGLEFPANLDQIPLPDHPARMPTPTGEWWPLHLLLQRPPTRPPRGIQSHPPATMLELVRVLIAAYPPALVAGNAKGHTPLFLALLRPPTDYGWPSLELIELLLGRFTPGFVSGNPAQIASDDSHQLPLHLACEEIAHDFELLSTLVEAYPAAKTVTDLRGRTPLHCVLENWQSIPVNESTLELLYDSKVARICDDVGHTPLDCILRCPTCVQEPVRESASLLWQSFLDDSIRRPHSWRDRQELLTDLRGLPPWLRRHACAASFCQEGLLEELASPWNTAWVLLIGGVWIGLLIVLRTSLHQSSLDTWVLVHYFAAFLLAVQVVSWTTAACLGEFTRLVLANPWRWIDVAAAGTSIATAVAISSDVQAVRDTLGSTVSNFVPADDDAAVATLGAWSTGLVWLSLLGFVLQWWCGMAVFVGSAFRLLSVLIWPFGVAGMGIVAMSQILYTLEDCVTGSICGLNDAYTTVYYMILGEPVLGGTTTLELTKSMMVLLTIFTILVLWWIVSVLVMTVSEAQQLDRHQIALVWFWEPKVSLTLYAQRPRRLEDRPTWTQWYCQELERLWSVLSSSLVGNTRDKRQVHWYACCFRPGVIVLTRLVALVTLPVWFLLGVATLGIVWPPQVRRWLFAPNRSSSTNSRNPWHRQGSYVEERLSAVKLSHLKGELLQFQTESREQGQQLHDDIAQIKDILFQAMMEEKSS